MDTRQGSESPRAKVPGGRLHEARFTPRFAYGISKVTMTEPGPTAAARPVTSSIRPSFA